jgi:hypothetical protein
VAEGQRKSLTDPHDPGQRTVTGGTPGTNPRNKPDVSGNLFVKGVPITVPKFDHKKQKDSTDSQGCPARKARNAALPSDSSPPLHSSMASGKPWKLLQTLDESERRTAIRYL